ncbi:MAG TPA: MFS transporter [Blastocatellia bacterium]|nr:MFS transporter [Blastocatellia bacterium]
MSLPATSADRSEDATRLRGSSFSALHHRDFRLLWIGQMISVTGTQMQYVAINWHVYLLTKSPLALGGVGLVRVVPIILCSLVGGVVADAVDRKRLMITTQSLMLISALLLAWMTASGLSSIWPIYLLTAVASAALAFDNPARQAMLPTLVPARDFPNAVSLGIVVFNSAMIVGPALAGVLLSIRGPALIYALNAASFVAVIVALLLMKTSGRAGAENEIAQISIAALRDGLHFVWRTPIIVQTMTLDFVATFFASATALLPIFAAEILKVGARGLGLLAAAPGAGSILAGLTMARLGVTRRQGKVVLASVAVYGAATIAFGLSRWFWLSLLMLGITGAADTVSTVIRQTIRQLVTPNYLRGRMTSVNMIFFIGGPQLGELEAGVVAQLIGATLSVFTGGVGCLIAVASAGIWGKSILRYDGALELESSPDNTLESNAIESVDRG